MPRYAKANQTVEDLKALILKIGGKTWYDEKGEGSPYEVLSNCAKVRSDLSKIDVDFENADFVGEYKMPGTESLDHYEMIGSGAAAFPVAWCACGGDWESPLAFVLYLGQKGELRGYIPEDGNAYNKKEKAAYGNNDDDPSWEDNPDNPLLQFDADKLRADVAGRIEVKSASAGGGTLTFRQLIQSLRSYKDQYASVMPYADGAEDPVWGINDIWFEDGVLMIGQYDDEGDSCEGIADGIEKCVPADKLDEPAVVAIGVTDEENGNKVVRSIYGSTANARTVASSVVKPASERVTDDEEEFVDDLDDDSWSISACKWVLKFE